mgnify:FL=1
MKVISTAVYSFLVALFLVLASGRFLHSGENAAGYAMVFSAAGLLLLSAALALLVQRDGAGSYRRMLVYCICAGLLLAVQLTGGFGSIFYFSYFLFLIWVSLPSVGSSATEMGLIIGFTEALALLNSSIWGTEASFITRVMPLLLPALRSLLVPFLFGLAADWMIERELVSGTGGKVESREEKGKEEQDVHAPAGVHRLLIEMLHGSGGADSTCLFLLDDNGYYSLAEHASSEKKIISRFLLPPGHRLSRIASRSSEPVLIRAGSRRERSELSPYRLAEEGEEGSLWILICPFGRRDRDVPEGFLLQDFADEERPGDSAVAALRELADALALHGGDRAGMFEDGFSWMARLVSACNEDSIDGAVAGMAGILSEMIHGSTVSVADVDSDEGRLRIWVSRGPLARWRRGKVFHSAEGVAGWIVKNRVPCRRSRLSLGSRGVGCFTSGKDTAFSVGSIMGVPVLRSNEVIALIMVEHEDDDVFGQEHESMLSSVAGLFSLREELADLRSSFRDISGKDTITGLPGITLLSRHLHHMAREVQTYGWSVGVLVADIDGFETLNRQLGYSRCDLLLKTAAVRFRKCFSEEVFVARTGPDSFAACIPRAGKAVMEAMCQRAADALSFQFGGEGSFTGITASVGGVYTHVNRKVLLLTGEAETAVDRARSASPGSCLVTSMELNGTDRDSSR